MNNIIRITCAVNKVNCANPLDCADEIINLICNSNTSQSDIIVLPKLALCSPSCGNLFLNNSLINACEEALAEIQAATIDVNAYVIIGLVVADFGKPVSAMAVLRKGELIGLIPCDDNLKQNMYSEKFLPEDTVFSCGNLSFGIVNCQLNNLVLNAAQATNNGCDLLIAPCYSPVYAGLIDDIFNGVKAISLASGCAIALVNGGIGDTSSPYIYSGFTAIYESGKLLAHTRNKYESFASTTDLDIDIICASKKNRNYKKPICSVVAKIERNTLMRYVDKCPWLPSENKSEYLAELFTLQAQSLASRMENTGISRLVIGISGGLDSTAALMVATSAMDILDLPYENIHGITMPGFGTSDHTYYNALALLENLKVTRRDISIKQAVQLHLEDISHCGKKDTTYENAQARERAQILLDYANSISGLVVGTGDLSEEALGFCTFAGDHISNYNVNVCIPKTILREIIMHLAKNSTYPNLSSLLMEVIETPISPELLPPSDIGEITQKTEEILGPYELHDFFIYYFLKYNMQPSKIYYYACNAFSDSLSPDFIREKLILLFKKFCAGQFKRSCAPDAASITEINLCGINYYIPSDLDPSFLLKELNNLL